MKFEKGDRVRVKTDLIRGKTYGADSFVGDMEKHKGKEFEIKNVYMGKYELDGADYWWTDEMLDLVKKHGFSFKDVLKKVKDNEIWTDGNIEIKITNHDVTIKSKKYGLVNSKYSDDDKCFVLKGYITSFDKAFHEYENGSQIKSLKTGYIYEKHMEEMCYSPSLDEIRGEWLVLFKR